MKTIIKTTILLIMGLMFNNILAQPAGNLTFTPFTCDEYIQKPENEKFVGTWLGSANGKTILLELKNMKVNYSSLIPSYTENTCIDLIYGFHQYLNNGNELESTLSYSNTTIYDKKNSILGASNVDNPNIFTGTLIHQSKNKSVKFVISYIDPTQIKIESLINLPGVKINEPGKPPYDSSITLPSNIILTKQ